MRFDIVLRSIHIDKIIEHAKEVLSETTDDKVLRDALSDLVYQMEQQRKSQRVIDRASKLNKKIERNSKKL